MWQMPIPGVIPSCQYGYSVLILNQNSVHSFFVKFESATQRLRQGMLILKDYLELLTHLPPLPQYWAYMFM